MDLAVTLGDAIARVVPWLVAGELSEWQIANLLTALCEWARAEGAAEGACIVDSAIVTSAAIWRARQP